MRGYLYICDSLACLPDYYYKINNNVRENTYHW